MTFDLNTAFATLATMKSDDKVIDVFLAGNGMVDVTDFEDAVEPLGLAKATVAQIRLALFHVRAADIWAEAQKQAATKQYTSHAGGMATALAKAGVSEDTDVTQKFTALVVAGTIKPRDEVATAIKSSAKMLGEKLPEHRGVIRKALIAADVDKEEVKAAVAAYNDALVQAHAALKAMVELGQK